jgi:cytochrome c oxidase cbb3-type subunit 4
MNAGVVSGVVTALLLLTFVGGWAWSGKRKQDFEMAARLPLDEPENREDLP